MHAMERKTMLAALAAFALAACARAEAHTYALAREGCSAAAAPTSISIGDTFDISFPDGSAFSLKVVSAPPAGIAGQSFIARDGRSNASAVVKPLADGVRIAIDDFENARNFSLRVKDGVATYSIHDNSDAPADVCATCNDAGAHAPLPQSQVTGGAPKKAQAAKLLLADAAAFPLAEQRSVVDILVAFDQGAKAKCASLGFDGMDDFADYAVNKMNTVLANSKLDHLFSYRLVGVAEIDGAWTQIDSALLNSLRIRNGSLAKLSQARETCGADTITLLIDRTNGTTSGIAYEYNMSSGFDGPLKFDSQNYACNVCDINTVYSRYTMSHETGHNMGCGHSNRQGSNSGPGRYSDSCGYHFTDANDVRRSTVMAYTYAGDDNFGYNPIPYFSTPDISPAEYGCALGVEGTNNNRRALTLTHADIAGLREHVVPYEWDVRFVDDGGNDIPDGAYFPSYHYVTMTNSVLNATIYYTYDGSTPTASSASCSPGTRFTMSGKRTITACAVTNGVALSVRTITFNQGLAWSGEAGQNGNGAWLHADASVRAWSKSSDYFINDDSVVFPDLAQNAAPTVSVHGTVAPSSAAFPAVQTVYTFNKGTADALIHLRGAAFAPHGDLTFNVPVWLDAVAFTSPANHTVAFNAPFGQSLTETSGHCTNMIGIGAAGTLAISPGAGKTQTFDFFNNVGWFYNTAQIRVGEGTVVFKGPVGNRGLFGSAKLDVAREGRVILDVGSAADDPLYTSVVSGEGTVVHRAVLPLHTSHWTNSAWRGTIAFEGLAADATTKDFQFENYGNANSKILLRNCAISYLMNNNATFPGTLVLDGDGALRFGDNGYSNNYNVFGALEGDGSISASSNHKQAYVFNVATNYTGSITIGGSSSGRRIVFGTANSLPSQAASITVQSGATASIGGGATWSAYHGIDVSGTLIVKGADATLACNASAALGLRLKDGATLRFDAADAQLVFARVPTFASGGVKVAFAGGVLPADGKRLLAWPEGSVPNGTFAFADAALASGWELVKTSAGLVVKPKNRYDVPGTGGYIAYDSALESWLDDENFWMYEELGWTWQEFMDETGANGYLNWQNYILGLSASDPLAKIKAKIGFDSQGNVVVSVADSIPRAPTVAGFSVECELLQTADLENWPSEGAAMNGKAIAIPVEHGNRFYKVTVKIR